MASMPYQFYNPPEVFKPFTNKMFSRMSEDDCKNLCKFIFDELSKDNRTLVLSPTIETALIAMLVDKVS